MLFRSIALLFFLFASVGSSAASILVWGDSLSAGYGLAAGESWPSLLKQRLSAKGYDMQVINGSVSGETTAGGRTRLSEALARSRPEYVILALGANDGLRGLPLGLMRDNLKSMIDSARAAGAKVLLVGMRLPPNYGPSYAAKFQETFTRIAEDESLPALPFLLAPVAMQRDYFQEDGLHPTAAAQPLIMDAVWAKLEPMLKAAR